MLCHKFLYRYVSCSNTYDHIIYLQSATNNRDIHDIKIERGNENACGYNLREKYTSRK